MKRTLLLLLFGYALFYACNNKADEQKVTTEIKDTTKNYPHIDSLAVNCIDSNNLIDKIDTIILNNRTLTCKFGMWLNCAYGHRGIEDTLSFTFSFINDTLNFMRTKGMQSLTCDCYTTFYIRLKFIDKRPKGITVDGNKINGEGNPVHIKEDAVED